MMPWRSAITNSTMVLRRWPPLDAVKFPVLSANIDASQSEVLKGKLKGSAIIEVGGEKIGIVGGTTLDTPRSRPRRQADLHRRHRKYHRRC